MKKALISLLFLMSCFSAQANESKVMHVVFEDYLPSASFKDGKAIGVDVEILSAAMKESGVEVAYEMYPWSRCLEMLDEKKVDAVIPMVFSKERDEKYTLGDSMRTRGNVIVLNKSVKKEVNSVKDLDGMTIGMGQGYAISKEFDDATNFTKEKLATSGEIYKILLQKVATKRNDGAVIDISVVRQMIKQLNIEKDVKVSNFVIAKATHVGFSKNNPFFPMYQSGFKTIKNNGTLKKILDKWNLE